MKRMKVLLIIIVMLGGAIYGYRHFGIKYQLISELRKNGKNVVDVTDIQKIKGLNNCYSFKAKYESYRENNNIRYGIDEQDYTVKLQHGKIVRGVADNTGLMSTAIQVCGE